MGGTIRSHHGGCRSQSVSHLTLAAAETWCLEQLTLPLNALGPLGRDLPFWIRLEYRILDGEARPIAGLRLHAAGADRPVEPAPEARIDERRCRPLVAARAPGCRSGRHAGRLPAMTLRNRLIAAFLAATLLPLAATIWITTSLLDRSLGYATTGELDRLSRTLEATVRQFYQREREALKQDALAGRTRPTTYAVAGRAAGRIRFAPSGRAANPSGSASPGPAAITSTTCGAVDGPASALVSRSSAAISAASAWRSSRPSFGETRDSWTSIEARDLRRGFTLTLLLLLGAAWLVSLRRSCCIAHRISQPIQQLTAALTDFAAGDWSRRLETAPGEATDEVGRAVDAFNHMAEQLRQSRERLVHLTQMASWQSLARKTAHELKNSLTPIRLTVEEMLARQPPADRAFMDQAVQIVVSEIESLERRVRAFSEFCQRAAGQSRSSRCQRPRHRTGLAAEARPSRNDVSISSSTPAGRASRGAGPGEGHPDESAAECRRSRRARRHGPRRRPGRAASACDRSARFRPGPERGSRPRRCSSRRSRSRSTAWGWVSPSPRKMRCCRAATSR